MSHAGRSRFRLSIRSLMVAVALSAMLLLPLVWSVRQQELVVRAETQLADLARCEFAFEPQSRQWLPSIDADGRSSVRGVYLAGDGARILGADAAEAAGRLAALAALADHGDAAGLTREGPALRRTLAIYSLSTARSKERKPARPNPCRAAISCR